MHTSRRRTWCVRSPSVLHRQHVLLAEQPRLQIPLMMEQGYKANGWLGLLLGTRMWYEFLATTQTEVSFLQNIDALTREIGDRGKKSPPGGSSSSSSSSSNIAAAPPAEGIPPPPPATPEAATSATATPSARDAFTPSLHQSPAQPSRLTRRQK